MRGDRLALIGPNGAGKSTMLRMVLGALQPDAGTVRRGANLQVAYFDQMRDALDPANTVVETISPGSEWIEIGESRKHVLSYLGDFLFAPQRANAPIRVLSGGERNRLLLARLFARPANVLVLDEPTNDLDIESLELLEATLQGYAGTLLLVSHDRAFLDNVATQSWVAEGDGRWIEYPGGYSDWLALRPPTPAAAPAPVPAPAAPRAPRSPSSRMSFKEKRELEQLPQQIEVLEAEQHAISERMSEPGYHRAGGEQIKADRARAVAIEEELARKFERWTELEQRAAAS